MMATKANTKCRLIALCLLLCSCGSRSPWVLDHIHSEKEEFCSSKLTYRAKDPLYGIDLELLSTQEHLNAYLNVHSIPVPINKDDPKRASLTLRIAGVTTRFSAYRLAGGQRFLLPEEIVQTLIEALSRGKEVYIGLSEYHTLFHPEGFSSQFQKLTHPPSFQNPFRLPY